MKTRSMVILVALASWTTTTAQTPFFTGLSDLPGGAFQSIAYAVSADGRVVVGSGTTALGREAFRWQDGVMTGLGDLPGGEFYSVALDVSADGSTIVGQGTNEMSPRSAVRWKSGVMTNLGELSPNAYSEAWGVSADGSVIVGASVSPTGNQAFRWTEASGMVGIGYLPGGSSQQSLAYAVSADGTTIVGQSTSFATGTQEQAFLWNDGSMNPLGFLATHTKSIAFDTSADGAILVGWSSPENSGEEQRAFRWHDGVMHQLANLTSGAAAVSADGSVIGGWATFPGSDPEAFIWDAVSGMQSLRNVLSEDYGLDPTGWTNFYVSDISADGQTFVGSGTNPLGQGEAWIAHIVACDDGDPRTVDFWNRLVGNCENLRIADGQSIQTVVHKVVAGELPTRLIPVVVTLLLNTP